MRIAITTTIGISKYRAGVASETALALVAVLLFSLTAAGLETRYGVALSAGNATAWVLTRE
jgi:hypothetical protein